jgi:MFS family permease
MINLKETAFHRRYKLVLLFSLYLSQGLPFGYQATALPVYLRQNGISLTLIGFSTILAAPWFLKVFWAPAVDTFWNRKTGRRRSWIIPLQVILFIAVISASFTSSMGIIPLAINIFIMNLTAATQDIAVDGLAVDMLGEHELGYGNAAQVVGYKAGMIISGGLLVWLTRFFGWDTLFAVMAVISILPLILILFYNETGSAAGTVERVAMKDVLHILSQSFHKKSFKWLILFVALYKFGEIMIDVMYKPFLIDSGFAASDIGLWVGTYGMAASICGSFAGGFLASKSTVYRSLLAAVILRLFPLFYVTFLTFITPEPFHVITATLLEHFFGGLLTTALFAFMMFNVDRSIGATQYTLLAAVEVIGKTPGALLSGVFTGMAGYSACFITGTAISLAVIFILPLYNKSLTGEQI